MGRKLPRGVHIATLPLEVRNEAIISTAVKLGHALIVKEARDNSIYIYAVKP